MKHFNPSCSSLHNHRLAGIPLSYSPQTKTPLHHRLQASVWRAIFAAWSHLRLKQSKTHFARPDLITR